MEGKIIRRAGHQLAAIFAVLVLCAMVHSQDNKSTKPDKLNATPAKVSTKQTALRASVKALPKGQIKNLSARVLKVKGTPQWRTSEKAKWKNAKVNDLIDPGSQIFTGSRESITLSIGENGKIVVERLSLIDLMVIIQEGDVLRTRVAVRRGRANFTVDKVGLINDAQVLTPTATLAVRGTDFSVAWGALKGVEINSNASNGINAIGVRYLLTNKNYFLSGKSTTRENQPNPVEVAFDRTFAPTMPGGLAEGEILAEFQAERRVDYSLIGLAQTSAFVSSMELPPDPMQPNPPLPFNFNHAPPPSTENEN